MSRDLCLPAPIGNQRDWLDHPAKRKVLRIGRRGGKTRFALIAAIVGHGPGPDGAKALPGIIQGGDVVWVAQDYPQLTTVMWREEIVPRFAHLPYAKLNAQEHTVHLQGLGHLYLRSAEAIGGIRGIGKNLVGVIVDEAAWLDLEAALQDVILAALLDNDGWLILMSTTNAGPDGNTAKVVPSYFNRICESIRAGERSAEWVEFTGTAFDNPALNPAGIEELIGEYAPGSPKLRQEVYAELLRAGIGLALPDVDAEHHVVPAFRPPSHWVQFGAFDWGFNHPWVFGWFTADEDGTVYLVDTLSDRGQTPREIAATLNAAVPVRQMRYVDAGHDCWNQHRARGESTPTIADQFQTAGIVLQRANISRVMGLNNLRDYTHWRGVDGAPDTIPRFQMMDTPGNLATLKQLQSMQIDPKNLEDTLKVDADHNGEGGDDRYDCVRYGLASRPFRAKVQERELDAFSPAVMREEMEQTLKLGNRLARRKRQHRAIVDSGGY